MPTPSISFLLRTPLANSSNAVVHLSSHGRAIGPFSKYDSLDLQAGHGAWAEKKG